MGVENYVDRPVAGKRTVKRARVLLSVKLRTDSGEIDGRLRDLSRKGALVECRDAPAPGSEVIFCRASTIVPARVAWNSGARVGLEFAHMIDESELLVQLPHTLPHTPSGQSQQRFRRPSLFGEMNDREKKLAQMWGQAVGIALPAD